MRKKTMIVATRSARRNRVGVPVKKVTDQRPDRSEDGQTNNEEMQSARSVIVRLHVVPAVVLMEDQSLCLLSKQVFSVPTDP